MSIRTTIPVTDDALHDLQALVEKAEAAERDEKHLILSYIGARMAPVLARLAAVEDELAKVRDELEHTRPAGDAALAWKAACDDVNAPAREAEDTLYDAASKLQAWRTATGREAGPEAWMVWSREFRTWWKPRGAGYTGNITHAGRFTRDAAQECAGRRSWRSPSEPPDVVVPAPAGYVLASSTRLTAYLDHHIGAATAAAVAERAAERNAVKA